MHPYSYVNEVQAQIDAVLSANIPKQLLPHKESLLSKLKAEKARLESTWYDDETYVRRPYMAIIKVNSVLSDSPVAVFGADVASQALVKISLYSARFNKVTKDYEELDLLLSCHASESQYADMLTNTNQEFSSCITYDVVDGVQVSDYDPGQDPTKLNLRAIVENAKASTTANESYLKQLGEITTKLEGGKLTKTDVQQLLRALGNLASMEKGNSEFRVAKVAEGIDTRLRETLLNIDGAAHLAISQHALEKK
ncbi:MAG: hypothetical protein CL840_00550 [Crocinitomicaceae bacterium]|nr:hypothetical protein [Crocinitomicaceae bacterium]|tara:strand:- start:158971 stop:159729 length:759 start_codon:yes stop_codon:yes gene_type:complete